MHNEHHGDARNLFQARDITVNLAPPEPPAPPWQLAAYVLNFVDRKHPLGRLSELVRHGERTGRGQVAFVAGPAGVGKSALLVEFALEERDRHFPGGALYVDLDEHRRRGGLDRSAVLANFLGALGMDNSAIPASTSGRAEAFTRLTTDRRVLVVVENVRAEEEVHAFAPGPGANMLVATSRRMLPGVPESGMEVLHLTGLDAQDGKALLAEFGPVAGKAMAAPEDTRRLVALCGGLPPALRMVAGYLQENTAARVSEVLRRLENSGDPVGGIDELAGTRRLRTICDMAYSLLGPNGAELYSALGGFGPDGFPQELAEAALGSPEAAREALDELCRSFLVHKAESDPSRAQRKRFTFVGMADHDARNRAMGHPRHGAPSGTRRRVVDWYRRELVHADRAVYGERLRAARLLTDGTAVTGENPFATPQEGLAELAALAPAVPAVVESALEEGMPGEAAEIVESLWPLVYERKHYAVGATALERVTKYTRDNALPAGVVARLRIYRARIHIDLGELTPAGELLREARRELEEDTRLRLDLAVAREGTALLSQARGEPGEAAADLRRARDLHREAGNPRGVALQSYQVAEALFDAGDTAAARRELDEAMELVRTWLNDNPDAPQRDVSGWWLLRARMQLCLARVLMSLEEDEHADAEATTAMQSFNEAGYHVREAQAQRVLADLAGRRGERGVRADFLRRARELYAAHRMPQADEMGRLLKAEGA